MITVEQLKQAMKELAVEKQILNILQKLPPARRLPIFKAVAAFYEIEL